MKYRVLLSVVIGVVFTISGCKDNSPTQQVVKKPKVKPIPYVQAWTYGQSKLVAIDKEHSENSKGILALSQKLCEAENICIAMFWDDIKLTPRGTPMTDKQVEAKVAHYNYNKNTGLNRLRMCRKVGC